MTLAATHKPLALAGSAVTCHTAKKDEHCDIPGVFAVRPGAHANDTDFCAVVPRRNAKREPTRALFAKLA